MPASAAASTEPCADPARPGRSPNKHAEAFLPIYFCFLGALGLLVCERRKASICSVAQSTFSQCTLGDLSESLQHNYNLSVICCL